MPEVPPYRAWATKAFTFFLVVLIAVIAFSVIMLVEDKSPHTTLWAILKGAFGSKLGILESLTRATPLLLCGLAVAIPARVGLVNIGGEGQLHLGAVGATAAVIYSGGIPDALLLPLMFLAAVLAGCVWAAIPGLLRARLDVNEVLVSLMFNYVGIYLVQYLVNGPWKDPAALGWPYSIQFPEAAVLPSYFDSNVHLGLLIGVGVTVLGYIIIRTTAWGFYINVIEKNPATARYARVKLASYYAILMILGGSLAAIAGLGEVSVIQGRLRAGLSPGYGYSGFVVSWLSGHHFLWMVPVAILVGGFYSGADAVQLTSDLPGTTADIFMGLVFLAFLLGKSSIQQMETSTVTEGGA